ncbi:hypothetical protein COLU111180_10820 [Cohnella lubricantis]|uniref:Uncharacterized protein n=1 Tax=Cohnella lubricantis TaxID=2163172 RepID=A0A841TAE9_9BACL|nr:hypothetical protein [Cohnella lubricantis]MBB6678274.1 hypothetical protein [Cohnella lubricantis]MBP2118476.1 putative membrane protein [Cohnella lubricantis]
MNLDFEAWKQFAIDHWIIIVVAIVAMIVIVKLVKTLTKWVLVAAIVVGLAVYGGYSINDLKEVGSKVSSALLNEAIASMAGEAADAKYTLNEDGTYTVTSNNLTLSGVPNSGEVKVTYRGVTFPAVPLEGAVREFVVQAREASQ